MITKETASSLLRLHEEIAYHQEIAASIEAAIAEDQKPNPHEREASRCSLTLRVHKPGGQTRFIELSSVIVWGAAQAYVGSLRAKIADKQAMLATLNESAKTEAAQG